jgi:ABC-type transporter Mla subunit MlaD
MDEKQKYWRLGLFVLITLIVTLGLLLMLGLGSVFKKSFVFETYFDSSVSGLTVGSPVEFRGIPLGEVTEIFSSTVYEADVPIEKRKGYIVVRAQVSSTFKNQTSQLERDIPEYVRRGLRAQTQSQGITGQLFLSLDLLGPEQQPSLEFDWQPEHIYIPSAPSLTGEFIAQTRQFLRNLNDADIQGLGENLNTLIVNLNSAVEQVPVKTLTKDISDILMNLNDAVERIDRALASAPLDVTFQNMQSASARLDTLLAQPALQRTIDNAGTVTDVLREAAESGELDRVISSVDQTVQRLDSMLTDNQYDIRVLVQDLRTTASNLRTLSENAKRYPAGTLIGGPPKKIEIPEDPK